MGTMARTRLFSKIILCNPLIYTIDFPGLTVSNFRGNYIGLKSVK